MPEELEPNDAAEAILESIAEPGDDEPVDPGAAQPSDEAVDNAANEADTSTKADDTADEPVQSAEPRSPAAIAPPVSWDAEAKARFQKLPPETQRYIAERESQRDKGLSEAQRKAADADKAMQAKLAETAAERQAYAERLKAFVDVAKVNPKLAEWQKRDWAKFASENPLESQSEWFAYQQTLGSINAAEAERQAAEGRTRSEQQQSAHKMLTEKLDFWAETDKRNAFQSEFRNFLKTNPDATFSDAELDGMSDPRVVLLGRKAMLYDKLMAEQATIAKAKKPAAQGKILRTQATSSEGDSNPRADALLKRAAKTGRTDDQTAAILALLN